jgi:hypothetical protein
MTWFRISVLEGTTMGCDMTRGIKRSCLLAGLAVFGAMVVGGRDAQAGTVGVKGTVAPLPGGSPFLYTFDLFLTGGTIAPGATFTIGALTEGTVSNGLVGVTTQSGTEAPSFTGNPFATEYPGVPYYWVVPSGGIDTIYTGNPVVPYDKESSVTWLYLEGPSVTWNGANIFLGSFTVETAASFPDNMPPATPGQPIDYSYSGVTGGDSPSTGGGTITLSAIPEPSSLVLLLAGGAALPILLRLRGRSRASRTA